jgi:hypothetical protein
MIKSRHRKVSAFLCNQFQFVGLFAAEGGFGPL